MLSNSLGTETRSLRQLATELFGFGRCQELEDSKCKDLAI